MIHRLFTALLVLVLSILPGCMKHVRVAHNTFSAPQHIPEGFRQGSSFCLISLRNNDLFSQEVSYKIAKSLRERGYSISDAAQADYCLFFDFDISSSINVVHEQVYIPGQKQVKKGQVKSYGTHTDGVEYEETTQGPATVVIVPKEYCTYKRSMTLDVYDARLYKANLKPSSDVVEQLRSWLSRESEKDFNNLMHAKVWQGSAVSCGHNGDLREIIDHLLESSFKYFGRSTNKTINETHSEFSWFPYYAW